MTTALQSRPNFWSTVRLLLGVARKRSTGRRKRQRELLHNRAGQDSTDWGGTSFVLGVLFMMALNIGAAFVVQIAVECGERIEAERRGKIIVSGYFLYRVRTAMRYPAENGPTLVFSDCSDEARQIADKYGGDQLAIQQKLCAAFRAHGPLDFIANSDASPGVRALLTAGRLHAMLGSMLLLWWAVMLVFQGEGPELDLQRRRHPMWEWLFSHPAPAGAIFLAEMLSPIAANPVYWGGPLFVAILYGFVYGPLLGILAGLLIGIPVTIAAACLGKALEIGVTLRFSPRSRGAMIGFMGWLGYASLMLLLAGLFILRKIIMATAKFLDLFTMLPWPWLRLFLGGQSNGSFSFLSGMLACWAIAGITVAGSVWFTVWGAQQGLSGNFAAADSGPSASRRISRKREIRFGKDPLYRKEFLWFIRDRSAIVQVILIPITVASFQLFNLRGLLGRAQGAWNYLCGAAILFGTYFLWILGPKSLSSEGTALWIALTWPRGLESLLKAKAWLWSMISSVMVLLVLSYTAFLFPGSIWKIALVGVGWFIFGRSMADKSVTLVSVTSSSGEVEPIPRGRRWAAQLGMLTFSIGVLMQQWHIAVVGIVYSYMTAAAMWQNFRARLPYLYDPWSEQLPPPPTLMHAMVAISILVEGGAVLTGMLVGLAGRENIAVAQAISYGISAVIVSIGMSHFLSNRGVLGQDVWRWGATPEAEFKSWWGEIRNRKFLLSLLLGAAGGLVLGLFAHGYVAVLRHIPSIGEIIQKSEEQMAKIPNLKLSYAVMAVGFAPFAEEYLFRGLLFRALDREWGGWRAVIGSAAFFASYHSPFAWLPVALLGVTNALLFKRTGRLAPAVVLHMVYNAVVLS
ncbi:MAG: family intrarane metalloprotease [Candidatus Sulfotelmatobacter sp.]|nr:family intrarane metalloprotease [Candidatus Sulfotelmatobacter sp.]